MTPFTWLHLSDIHLTPDLPFEKNRVLHDLLKCLEQNLGHYRPVHAVFITGDLAQSGKLTEYRERASEFLRRIVETLGVGPSRVFAVPGNHDVDWDSIHPYHQLQIESNPGAIARVFEHQRTLELLNEKFTGFAALSREFHNVWSGGRHPYVTHCLDHEEARIGIVGMNTAWLVSGDSAPDADKGKLVLGRPHVDAALEAVTAEHADITFLLMHHPLSWLRDAESTNLRNLFMKNDCMVLSGHLHQPDCIAIEGDQHKAVFLQSGALYSGTPHPKLFFVGQWNPTDGSCRLTKFCYDDTGAVRSWFPHAEVAKFKVPRGKPAGSRGSDASGFIKVGTIPALKPHGSWADPIGCVHLTGSDAAFLDNIEMVSYHCHGGTLDGHTLHNRSREEHFAQAITVPIGQSVEITPVITHRDRSKRSLASVTLKGEAEP